MCAIIGAVGKIPERERVIRARDTMVHRGPDDAGIYYAPEEGVTLGHRRLAIIDLSPAGRQPMMSADGRYKIVYNGEIYNFREIKEKLNNSYNFKTKTDTEVLLAAYMKWGAGSISHLRGMFSFAIWDAKEKKLFMARDRFGIKPLYYALYNDTLYFSSEVKGILVLTDMPRILNRAAIIDYLSYRYPLGGTTFFQGISSLLPGHYLTYALGQSPTITQYWDVPVVTDKIDPGEGTVIETFHGLLRDCVKAHMISDVPLGAYLSGGVDSSLLVALMATFSQKPVKTFSVGFKEEKFNEFHYARMVAERYGTDHHEIIMGSAEYTALLPEVIRFKDAPLAIPNEVPLHMLSSELKKEITVVLSGEGADELYGGYGKIFRSGYDLERLEDFSYLTQSEQAELAENLKKKYRSLNVLSPLKHFLHQYSYWNIDEKKNLLNSQLFDLSESTLFNEEFFRPHFARVSGLSPSEQYLYLFSKVHIIGPLERLDVTTMSRSVEARVPYVDHILAEYVSHLPLSYRLRWKSEEDERRASVLSSDEISEVHDIPKYLLRRIGSEYLPREVVERKKLAFPVPLNEWFGGSLRGYAKEVLLAPSTRLAPLWNQRALTGWLDEEVTLGSRRGLNIWMLINLELWASEYKVTV